MSGWLATELFSGVTVRDLVEFLGVLVGAGVVSAIVGAVVRRTARALDEGTVRRALLESFDGPLRWFLLAAATWGGLSWALRNWAEYERDFQYSSFVSLAMPFALWWSLRLVNGLTEVWSHRAERTSGTFDDQLVPIVRTGARIVLVLIGGITIIQNFGADVGSLIAGLGIGGVAVAMAAKDTIANLFGSLVIFIDRPFQIGDWVEIGDQEGTVEEVGLRVTRIRTFANSIITVPNASLTTTAINNWSKMNKRRIKMTIGLTYDTTAGQMEDAIAEIRDALKSDERIDQDFMLVNFTNFGASSLDIFVYCFTVTTRWDEYMQVREELFLEFMRRIEKLGLGFAFPTQTIHLETQLRDSVPGGGGLPGLPGGPR